MRRVPRRGAAIGHQRGVIAPVGRISRGQFHAALGHAARGPDAVAPHVAQDLVDRGRIEGADRGLVEHDLVGQRPDRLPDLHVEGNERGRLHPVDQRALAVPPRPGAEGDADMDDLHPRPAAETHQPLQVRRDLLHEGKALVQMPRHALVIAQPAHPAFGMGTHVLHVDDQKRRLRRVEGGFLRFQFEVPIRIVNHACLP